jgi:hypothetical protein
MKPSTIRAQLGWRQAQEEARYLRLRRWALTLSAAIVFSLVFLIAGGLLI